MRRFGRLSPRANPRRIPPACLMSRPLFSIAGPALAVMQKSEGRTLSDKTEHPPVPDAFAALGVRPSILRALADLKFTKPSEIQSLLIPRALAGVDLLGQARTGTGKTASFMI